MHANCTYRRSSESLEASIIITLYVIQYSCLLYHRWNSDLTSGSEEFDLEKWRKVRKLWVRVSDTSECSTCVTQCLWVQKTSDDSRKYEPDGREKNTENHWHYLPLEVSFSILNFNFKTIKFVFKHTSLCSRIYRKMFIRVNTRSFSKLLNTSY